jgi:hypothetical protein
MDVAELSPICGCDVRFGVWRFSPIVEQSTEDGMAILKKIAADASKKRECVTSGHD